MNLWVFVFGESRQLGLIIHVICPGGSSTSVLWLSCETENILVVVQFVSICRSPSMLPCLVCSVSDAVLADVANSTILRADENNANNGKTSVRAIPGWKYSCMDGPPGGNNITELTKKRSFVQVVARRTVGWVDFSAIGPTKLNHLRTTWVGCWLKRHCPRRQTTYRIRVINTSFRPYPPPTSTLLTPKCIFRSQRYASRWFHDARTAGPNFCRGCSNGSPDSNSLGVITLA